MSKRKTRSVTECLISDRRRDPIGIIDDITNEVAATDRADLVDFLRGQAQGALRVMLEMKLIPNDERSALLHRIDVAGETAVRNCRRAQAAKDSEAVSRAASARIERDFFVEQARALQNQVQVWQRMYSDLLAQVQRGLTDDGVQSAISETRAALEEPVVGIEAVRALTAELSGNAQGHYTAMNTPVRHRLARTQETLPTTSSGSRRE